MKRKIVVFILIFGFNILLFNGISYVNQVMFEHNFVVSLNGKPQNDDADNNLSNNENEVINTEYDGESIEKVAQKIEKYFKKTGLEGYGEYVADVSIKKGVNPYLIAGIILENTKCTTDCSIIFKNCNNVGDLRGAPGCFGGSYKKYDDIESSIKDLVNYIYNDFVSNKITSPSAIYLKYGKDITWAFKVTNYMEKIKKVKIK